jgi:hypothetical protein
MKLQELTEDLRRVSPREKNPNWTSEEVVKQILSGYNVGGEPDLNTDGGSHSKLGDFIGRTEVVKSWVGNKAGKLSGIYNNYGTFPGEGGTVGLPNPNGKTPEDIASGAHEAFHALLQMKYKNYKNEHVVNRLAARWLQDHYSGKFLHFALNSLRDSRVSYKDKKYIPSKTHLDDERKALPKRKTPWW